MRDFGRGSMLNNLELKPHNIIVACTSEIDYEMDRVMLINGIDGLNGEYLVLYGGHCSCFDFDETEWNATAYTKRELELLATAPYNLKNDFWKMVRIHFGIKD